MLSHPHRTLFVHVPKCGGISIERMFLADLGLAYSDRDALLLRVNPNRTLGPHRLAHLTYREYTELFYATPEMLAGYYRFAVVRDPYRRVASFYTYLGYRDAISFERFVTTVLPAQLQPGAEWFWFMRPAWDYLRDANDELGVTEVFRLENMAAVGTALAARFNARFAEVPHVNSSKEPSFAAHLRNRWTHAKQGLFTLSHFRTEAPTYTPASRRAVNAFYADDFARFGYDRID